MSAPFDHVAEAVSRGGDMFRRDAFLFILKKEIRAREVEFLRRYQVFEEPERYESADLGIWTVWFEVVKV